MGLSRNDYERLSPVSYGNANPERIENELWQQVIREDWDAYALRNAFNDQRQPGREGAVTSKYREQKDRPVWCWDRMGMSETRLEDGRVVYVGGEYEDFYDPDFCIFNDVVVEHTDGRLEIYGYPKDVFPPTDFHSATRIGDDIILIGSVGYKDLRRHGETQVFRLDTNAMRIEPVETSGPCPGWISHHTAEFDGERSILIVGGMIERLGDQNTDDGTPVPEYVANENLFVLDIATNTWSEVAFADRRFFDVSKDDYRKGRNPRFGTTNPERVDNPFWTEMVRRGWGPGRARLHFADPPPEQNDDDLGAPPTRNDIAAVVWTAVRDDTAELTLEDGRHLTIGGEFSDFGVQRPDRWFYNDIIVRDADGNIDVFTYPADTFPPLMGPCALRAGGRNLIFGPVSHLEPARRWQAMAFELDAETMKVTLLDAGPNRPVLITHSGPHAVHEDRIEFPLVRQTSDDPVRFATFDLETLRWRYDDTPGG